MTIYTVESVKEPGAAIQGVITDVDALEMGIFTGSQLRRGTPILVEIGGKLEGKLQAKVISCNQVPISNHILKAEANPELWRVRIRAIVGGEDEAKFPQELVDALMKENKG